MLDPQWLAEMTPLLQSSAASMTDHFQDQSLCGNVSRRTCLSTGTMHTSGECSRTSSTVICIDWMCRDAKSADVNLSAQHSPSMDSLYETVCSLLCLSLNTFGRHLNSRLFQQSWTSHGVVVASCDSGAVYYISHYHTYIIRAYVRFVTPLLNEDWLIDCNIFYSGLRKNNF